MKVNVQLISENDLFDELISNNIINVVCEQLCKIDIEPNKIAEKVMYKILFKIKQIIKNDSLSDFDKIEEIVLVFEEYNIDFGNCHDY